MCLVFSTQQSTTFTKKMIEDNNAMDETVQFLSVSAYKTHCAYIYYVCTFNMKRDHDCFDIVCVLGALAIFNDSTQRSTAGGNYYVCVHVYSLVTMYSHQLLVISIIVYYKATSVYMVYVGHLLAE